MAHRRNRPINLPAPYLKRLDRPVARERQPPIRSACRFCSASSISPSIQAITIIVGENSGGKSTLLEGIAAMAGYDEPAAARATCRSIIPTRSRRWAAACRETARELAAEDHHRMVLSRRELLLGGALSRPGGLGKRRQAAELPVVFAWRGLCGSSGAAGGRAFSSSASRNRVVAIATNQISPTRTPHGSIEDLPGHHGDPLADHHGLSGRACGCPSTVWTR